MRLLWVPACAVWTILGCGSTDLPATTADSGAAAATDAAPSIAPQDEARDAAGPAIDGKPAKDPADADKPGKGDEPDASKGGSTKPDPEPGTPVTNRAAMGPGPCAGKTLAQVIAAAQQQMPALADITVLDGMDPNISGGANLIHAFTDAKGFRVVFHRGANDCPGGCIDNWYWYFSTDDTCAPVAAGQHARVYSVAGNCYQVEGKPLWNLPPPIDPALVCGADNKPVNVAGTYKFRGVGTRTACTEKAGNEPSVKVGVELVIIVAQEPGDLARGTVTIHGAGHPRLDGVTMPATFMRRRVKVMHDTSNLPAMCVDETKTTLELDFEAAAPGQLTFFEVRALGCPPSQDYCKGELTLELTPTK